MNFSRRHLLAAPFLARMAQAANLNKIHLGVTTDEIHEDLVTALKFLNEFQVGECEIRNLWGKYNTAQPLEKVREARQLLDQHKVKLAVLATGFFKIPLPPDTPEGRAILDNQWSLLDSAMERAKILGTDKIRTFGFTYKSTEQPAASAYPRIYELVAESARRAKARGFRLVLENVGGSYIWSGAQAAALLKAVKEDALGLTWDPNNAAASGEKSYPDGFRLLDPARIWHVHLRDFKQTAPGKWDWTAVGQGEMDNLGQIRDLLKWGYKESFTLETHYKHPDGKMAATRTSLPALLEVFRKA